MKLPRSYYNYISYLGTIIATIAWFAIIFFIVQINFFKLDNVYFDLYAYLVTPGFLVLGLVMISAGMIIKKRKLKKGKKVTDDLLFVVNLREPKTRNAVLIFTVVTIFFIMFTVIGSYKGFHYTESVEFCGELCHGVMDPEFVAYQNSPHAKVKCAECHVGEGADFYVKSKMSGMRQVFKYTLGTYPRPIETPIENLRPARETCEKCHWPQKFYTNGLRKEKYYLADETNTEWNVMLNMKIGASHQALGNTEGIHWHISKDVNIEYKADKKRSTIYWVKKVDKKTGKETIYTNSEINEKADSITKSEARPMDCMDCHNRPSHEFRSPSKYVNDLFASNKIAYAIPWLKSAAMEAHKVIYSTKDSSLNEMKNKIISFYQKDHPEIYKKYSKEIVAAINEIQGAFSKNAFPEMKVNYSKYPRHIGHLETNGCFRCHNNKFKSATGKVISKDCNLCHTIVAQGKRDSIKYAPINSTLEFMHPVDIGDAWKESNCMDCHNELYK